MRLHALLPVLLVATVVLRAESPAPVLPPALLAAPAPEVSLVPEAVWRRQQAVRIVENVDGRIITAYDVRRAIAPAIRAISAQVGNIPDPAQREREAGRLIDRQFDFALEDLTNRELTLSDLDGRKAKLPPSVVTERIDERIIREFGGDRAEYLRTLRAQGRTAREDREDVEKEILLTIAAQETRRSVSGLSPAKTEAYYRDNAVEFERKAAIKFSQISLSPGAASTDADTRKLAAEIRARLDKGESFEDLAKKYSSDGLAEAGGVGDWRELTGIDNRIAGAITALQNGEYTAPIEIESGGRVSLFILRRDDYRAAGSVPIAEVRRFIERKLFDKTASAVLADRMMRLREKYYIRRFDPLRLFRYLRCVR